MIEAYRLRSLPADEAAELYRAHGELHRERRPDDPWPGLEAWLVREGVEPEHLEAHRFRLRAPDGTLAGVLRVGWGRKPENRHLAETWFAVLPRWRRHGNGRRLLARAAEVAQADGRTHVAMATSSTVPAGQEFCRAVGAKPVLEQHENRLRLDQVDRELLRRWIQDGESHATDYELILVDGPTPPELLDRVARAVELMNHAPRGDSVLEDSKTTPDQVRSWEAAARDAGLVNRAYFAKHRPTGEFVGFTNLMWHPETAALLQQGGTAVDPAHRGHGLGKWMKAAMLERVLAEVPEAREVETENAYVNDPMLSINNRLGFRPHGTETWWEIEASRCLANA